MENNDSIYVYTPKGDVLELPAGATPVDFAYKVHSEVGNTLVGAIVNENIVPLDYQLKTGDIIKVNTNASAKPNIDWLKFVKSSNAKELFTTSDIDGGLVGGASLKADEFAKIVNYNK